MKMNLVMAAALAVVSCAAQEPVLQPLMPWTLNGRIVDKYNYGLSEGAHKAIVRAYNVSGRLIAETATFSKDGYRSNFNLDVPLTDSPGGETGKMKCDDVITLKVEDANKKCGKVLCSMTRLATS